MNMLISTIKKLNLGEQILQGSFGIEKESIRINDKGEISQLPHPLIFGNKKKHPYITVDFSESQLELITPVLPSLEEAYNFLQNTNEVVLENLDKENLWNQSAPPILPENSLHIPLAKFDDDRESELYRENLADKYGRKKQLLSGIHFNFSFDDEVLKILFNKTDTKYTNFQDFKNDIYLKVARNYFRYGWLVIYLLGASPTVHQSYEQCCTDSMDHLNEGEYYFKNGISFRNSICGYKNDKEFLVNHESLEQYTNSIESLIHDGILQNAREYYSPIRLKSNTRDILTGLKEQGILYIELRNIDLNPFNDVGVEEKDLQFLHLFLLYLLLIQGEGNSQEEYFNYITTQEILASHGRDDDFKMKCCPNHEISAKEYAHLILDNMFHVFADLGILNQANREVLNYQKQKLEYGQLYTERLIDQFKEKGFVNFHLENAAAAKNKLTNSAYLLKGYEDLELSTQILLKECLLKGIEFEILDRKENFIRLKRGDNIQYIKQATKTSLDSYISVLMMENKVVTKKILAENNISVPYGKEYHSIENALNDFIQYSCGIVIKPKSANFGLGITIFKEEFDKEEYRTALETAFAEDTTVIIENFIRGKEYRFLVIGDEVVGILHRVPANITGDGKHTIQELVMLKNQDPLRGKGYKTPLEKLEIGTIEKSFLQKQGLTADFVPKQEEIIYLRENSNISTGGDSIDYTDLISDTYKDIAVKSANSVGAEICGVDMMITDIEQEASMDNYAVIELNFNPAIHIHSYPFKGSNRKIAGKILSLLGY